MPPIFFRAAYSPHPFPLIALTACPISDMFVSFTRFPARCNEDVLSSKRVCPDVRSLRLPHLPRVSSHYHARAPREDQRPRAQKWLTYRFPTPRRFEDRTTRQPHVRR